ncbi:MAG: peptidoglycan bridge formation glycyltransferase FemA/FemB family protein [Chloroflexi bacterium]|nr:MAG: peptidoglycan bridge formation glycyltransferase FemA/FemB family protein [Chloroflexota bacterium]
MSVTPFPSTQPWDAFVESHPQATFLQLSAWGELKSAFEWSHQTVTLTDGGGKIRAGALLLFRRVAGLTFAYLPRGPLTDWQDEATTQALLERIDSVARARGAAFVKIEPSLLDTSANRTCLASYGFRPSPQTVQPRSTITLDISGSEEEILGRMKSKWRYNIRLAERKEVTVRVGGTDDLRHFQSLMETTGDRDGFAVHSFDYYRKAFDLLVPRHGVYLYAEYGGQVLASIVVLHCGPMAWYVWGASSDAERNRMPNHALQWAAIGWARERGAARYDFWGIPDEIGQVAMGMADGAPFPAEEIPVDVAAFPAGDLWGVFRFKQGFGGVVERTVGAWDRPLNRALYQLYTGGVALRAARESGQSPRQIAREALAAILPHRPANSPDSAAIQPVESASEWRSLLADLPDPHVLQSWEWGSLKAQTGWQAERFALPGTHKKPEAAFQYLWRQPVPRLPLNVGYVPKGPVLDWGDELAVARALAAVETTARRSGSLFVKIDPDVDETSLAGRRVVALLRARGWRFSPEQIQFKNTGITRLQGSEDGLLESFKSKWRYNVRLAERRGLVVRQGTEADLAAFYALYAETGQRDGFLIRPFAYYADIWRAYLAAQLDTDNPAGGALLLAEHPEDGAPVSGIFLLRYGSRAWYFYGASGESRRRDMPNYLLQWEGMRWARAQGCTVYDWWGAPTTPDDPEDSLQGVWRFKEGFGAELRQQIGAWDWSPVPLLWRIYQRAMPLLLDVMRRRAAEE